MSTYRRATSGSTFFFTLVTHQRRPVFSNATAIAALRDAISRVRTSRPFAIDAFVLLPDHLHCIWTLPDGDSNFSIRWSLIKHQVAFTCRSMYPSEPFSISRTKHRDGRIWQRRFWEHRIRNDDDFQRHVDYIHFNPVKHGLVACASRWPHSTFHRYVTAGVYGADWAATLNEIGLLPGAVYD